MTRVFYPSLVESGKLKKMAEKETLEGASAPVTEVGPSTITHLRSFVPDRFVCGAPRDPSEPTSWGHPDCVVCMSICDSTPGMRDEIRTFWSGQ